MTDHTPSGLPQPQTVAWLIDFPEIPSVKPFAVDHIDNPAPGYRARPLGIIEDRPAVETVAVKEACNQAPSGWCCTRGAGHDGPCAAVELPVSREWCATNPGSAAHIIYLLAKQIDAAPPLPVAPKAEQSAPQAEVPACNEHPEFTVLLQDGTYKCEICGATPLPAQVQPAEQVGEPTDEQIDAEWEYTSDRIEPPDLDGSVKRREFARRVIALAIMTHKHAAPEGAEREALERIAAMDPEGIRADDLGRAARIARDALTQGKQQAEGAVDRSQPVGAGLTDEMDRALRQVMKGAVEMGWISDEEAREFKAALSVAASAPALQDGAGEGWIDVNVRKPEKNVEVLIAFRDTPLPATGQYTASQHDTWGWSFPAENDPDDTGPITHWKPLPEHPSPQPGCAAQPVAGHQGDSNG